MARLAALALASLTLALAGCGGADRVDGDGYSYELPGSWDDRSDSAGDISAGGLRPDTLVVGDTKDGFTPNINVLEDPSAAPGTTLDQYVQQSRRVLDDPAALETLGAGSLDPQFQGPVRKLELGGNEARSFDYTGTQQGRDLGFRQVYAVRDGKAIVVTFTGLRDRFSEDDDALQDVIDSWDWD